MKRLDLRKPAAPNAYELLREENAGVPDGPGLGSAIVLLIAGSGLFAVARTGLDPSIPPWLVPSGPHDPDGVVAIFALVSLIEWVLLIAFAVVPLVAVLVAVDRLCLAKAVTHATNRTRRWTYNGFALVSVAVSVPMWFFAWERAVKPVMNSLPGGIALFGLLALLGFYSLRKTRSAS